MDIPGITPPIGVLVQYGGAEHGHEFDFSWIAPETDHDFALDLDEYVFMLAPGADEPIPAVSGP